MENKTLKFLSTAITMCLEHSLPELSRSLSESLCGTLSEMEAGEKRTLLASKNFAEVKTDYTTAMTRNSNLVCQYCGSVLMPGVNCSLRVIPARKLQTFSLSSSRKLNRVYREYHGIADSLYNQRFRGAVNTCKGYEYFNTKKKERKMKNVLKVRCLACERTSLYFGTEKAAKLKKVNMKMPISKETVAKPAQKSVKKVMTGTTAKPQTKGVSQNAKVPEKSAKKKKKNVNDGGLGQFLSGLKF